MYSGVPGTFWPASHKLRAMAFINTENVTGPVDAGQEKTTDSCQLREGHETAW